MKPIATLTRAVLLCSCTALLLAGCAGDAGPAGAQGEQGIEGAQGPQGNPGTPAATTGDLTGVVSDATLNTPIEGVAVAVEDSGGAPIVSTTTAANGSYTVSVPFGVFKMKFTKANFTSPTPLVVGAIPGKTVTINVSLAEAATGKPTVTLTAASEDIGYGGTVTLTATATDPESDALTYTWKNGTMPVMGTVTGSGATGTLTMPTMAQAFARRENPTNPGEFIAGCKVPNRFGILPITPDCRAQMSGSVTVADGRGQSTTASVTVNATSVQGGIRTVATGARLYLNSGKDSGSSWTITAKPSGSTATLSSASDRTPFFTPDKDGVYTITEGTNTLTLEAGKWVGVVTGFQNGRVTSDANCKGCHNGTTAPDQFTPWEKTGHAGIFAAGINGGSGTSGPGCFDCHTVGNDKGAVNNGFDDIAKTLNWSWPAKLEAGNFASLLTNQPTLAKMTNIQCENCHGPQATAQHMQTKVNGVAKPNLSPRISMSAELCGTCHGRTSHHLYSEWATPRDDGMAHSNINGALSVGARGGTLNNSCGRCHTAQGFVKYASNLGVGKPGNLPATDTDGFALADVTAKNVEPVTCTACHDPHDATNPNQLRVYNDTGLLPSGFEAKGFGKGALCVTCHNSRNGMQTGSSTLTWLHEDTETYNSGNPTGYSAPHQAAQGDVFVGRNAYFLDGKLPMMSVHAAIEDTCVGCHMERNPQSRLNHGAPTAMGHLFRIAKADMGKLCAECHAEGINGEGIQAAVESGLQALGKKMGDAVKAKVNGLGTIKVIAYDPVTDLYSASASPITIDTSTNPVVAVGIEEGHGQVEFHLKFTSAVTVQLVDSTGAASGSPKQMTEFGVQMGSLKDGTGTAVYSLSGNMVRAGWNYFLVHGDATEGIHNPTFVQNVLSATLAQDLSN